jgi:hypothetical protein
VVTVAEVLAWKPGCREQPQFTAMIQKTFRMM